MPACVQEVWRRSLYLSLNFVINLTLLLKSKDKKTSNLNACREWDVLRALTQPSFPFNFRGVQVLITMHQPLPKGSCLHCSKKPQSPGTSGTPAHPGMVPDGRRTAMDVCHTLCQQLRSTPPRRWMFWLHLFFHSRLKQRPCNVIQLCTIFLHSVPNIGGEVFLHLL